MRAHIKNMHRNTKISKAFGIRVSDATDIFDAIHGNSQRSSESFRVTISGLLRAKRNYGKWVITANPTCDGNDTQISYVALSPLSGSHGTDLTETF